jgi:hypothetical protein
MISPDREREVLAEYEGLLAQATSRRDAAQSEVDSLTSIVQGISSRVAALPAPNGKPSAATKLGATIAALAAGAAASQEIARRGSLSTVLREVMVDARQRDVDEICGLLERRKAMPEGERGRQSVINRLGELVDEGYLNRVSRGTYQRRLPTVIASDSFQFRGQQQPLPASSQRPTPEGEEP